MVRKAPVAVVPAQAGSSKHRACAHRPGATTSAQEYWVPAFALGHAHISRVGGAAAGSTTGVSAPSARELLRVGREGASRSSVLGDSCQRAAPFVAPLGGTMSRLVAACLKRPPTPPHRFAGEGSGDAPSFRLKICACRSAFAGTTAERIGDYATFFAALAMYCATRSAVSTTVGSYSGASSICSRSLRPEFL